MLFLVLLLGCKKVEPLPDDADGLMHWLWDNLEVGEDADVHDGIVQLDEALGGRTLTEATDGSLTRLTDAQIAPLGLSERDPADAAGIFLANLIVCGLPTVAEIVTAPNQAELYEGVYEAYERTYDGDIEAFLAGDADTLTWTLDYTSSVLGSTYTGHTEALVRRVRSEDEDAPFGDAYVARFVAPEPAEFEEGSEKTFEQDYQLEVYWSREDGETLHAYGMWRQADWGAGFTSEDESVQRLILNGMEDWDSDTEKICEDGGP